MCEEGRACPLSSTFCWPRYFEISFTVTSLTTWSGQIVQDMSSSFLMMNLIGLFLNWSVEKVSMIARANKKLGAESTMKYHRLKKTAMMQNLFILYYLSQYSIIFILLIHIQFQSITHYTEIWGNTIRGCVQLLFAIPNQQASRKILRDRDGDTHSVVKSYIDNRTM